MSVLGERIRIGDIIQQERPNFESRKLCTLAAAQGANSTPGGLLKGQILGVRGASGPLGDIQKSSLVPIAATGSADKQVLTITGTSGTFYLKYKNVMSTVITVGTTTLAVLDALVKALHPDLAGSAVTGASGEASSAAIGAAAPVVWIGTTAAAILASGAEDIDTFDIVGDTSWKVSSSSVIAPITITHDTTGWAVGAGARAILLQDAPYSAATQTVLCAVRQCMVKPGYLLYTPSTRHNPTTETVTALQKAGVNANLNRAGIIVLTQPTSFSTAQDVDLTESVTLPSNNIAGL